MRKIYLLTMEPFHDNSTVLGAYASIDAAERSVSTSPDKWSRTTHLDNDNIVSRYLPDKGEDEHEVRELVIIDEEVMDIVDGKAIANVAALDERTSVLFFGRAGFYCVTHEITREAALKFAHGLSSRDVGCHGATNYRPYVMPDEDARMRAEEPAPEVDRALHALRVYAARQRPPIRIAWTAGGDRAP